MTSLTDETDPEYDRPFVYIDLEAIRGRLNADDAEFAAHAREDMALLIGHIDGLQKIDEGAVAMFDEVCRQMDEEEAAWNAQYAADMAELARYRTGEVG